MLLALFWIVVYAICVGVFLYYLPQIPFIPGEFKQLVRVLVLMVFGVWLVLACASLIAGIIGSAFPIDIPGLPHHR